MTQIGRIGQQMLQQNCFRHSSQRQKYIASHSFVQVSLAYTEFYLGLVL